MDFITEWGQIAGLAGLAIGIFLILFREVIRKSIFPTLTKKQSFVMLLTFMGLVFALSVFSIYFYYSASPRVSTYSLTVLVHEQQGKDKLVLPNRGKVKLLFGDAMVEETLNSKGEATFKQLPAVFFAPDNFVEIQFFDPEGEPYRAVTPDSLYTLRPDTYLALPVTLYGLARLRGIVKDFTTGLPVADVRVSIRGTEAFSNAYGEYELDIPVENQRQYQTVRAMKEGYALYEQGEVPIQTDREYPILLKALDQ
jgi:hypothetical protein